MASARRWLRVRGSSAHTVAANASSRCIDRVGVGGEQPAEHLGQRHPLSSQIDTSRSAAALPAAPHRITVGARHDPIHLGAQPTLRQRRPRASLMASSASTAAITSGSVIKSVRYTMV